MPLTERHSNESDWALRLSYVATDAKEVGETVYGLSHSQVEFTQLLTASFSSN